MLLEITGYSLLEARERQSAGEGKGGEILRVTASMCLNPIHRPSPQGRSSPHLCSRATRRSLSSLPRNPLAKGLFSIFSCVICQERRHRGVTGRVGENWASPAPCHRHIQNPGQHLGKWHLAGASLALKFSPALTRSPSGRPPFCVLLSLNSAPRHSLLGPITASHPHHPHNCHIRFCLPVPDANLTLFLFCLKSFPHTQPFPTQV